MVNNIKNLNQYPFNKLDAYNEEAYSWANKEYDLIKATKAISELNIDILSFTFASIYNHFLYISMNYAEGDVETWLQDFYKKDDIKQEWDILWKYKYFVASELFDAYKADHNKLYSNLVSSVMREVEDDNGDKVVIDPINNEKNSSHKHEEVMSFVLGGFNW